MIKKDLTGQQFGNLIVLEKDLDTAKLKNKPGHKRVYWKCKCLLCGKECSFQTTSLTTTSSKRPAVTCCNECAIIKSGLNRRKDISGQIFGNIKVLNINEDLSTPKNKKWNCICLKCGNECVKDGYDLRSGKIICCTSCAIRNRTESATIKMTGHRYGRLMILNEFNNDQGKKKVTCQCDCGNKVIFNRADVLSKGTESCGCLQKERASEASTKDQSNTVSSNGVKILAPFMKINRKNNQGVWTYECECPFCGNKFIEIPARIHNNHVQSCGCLKRSSPELFIESVLKEYNIPYVREFIFKDLYWKDESNTLRFDIGLVCDNKLIGLCEYDGLQHFKYIPFFHENLEGFHDLQARDKAKNDYCKKNNIPLLRLNYQMTLNEMRNKIKEFVSINSIDCRTA